MAFQIFESGEPVGDAALNNLQQRLRVKLPGEYKSFLRQYNGGRPDPYFFFIKGMGQNDFGAIQLFLGVQLPIRSSNLEWAYRTYRGRIPKAIFPIAFTGTGDLLCISLIGDGKRGVFLWDHDGEHSPATDRNVYFVAASLAEFLDSLHHRDLSADVARALVGARVK